MGEEYILKRFYGMEGFKKLDGGSGNVGSSPFHGFAGVMGKIRNIDTPVGGQIVVPRQNNGAGSANQVHTIIRIGTVADQVSQADGLVPLVLRDPKNRLEGRRVTMNIRYH